MPSLQKLPSDENLPVPQPIERAPSRLAALWYSPAARIPTPFVWRMSRCANGLSRAPAPARSSGGECEPDPLHLRCAEQRCEALVPQPIERGSTRVCSLFLLAAALTLRTVVPHTEGVADQVRIPRPKIVQGLAPSTARSRSETFSRRRAWEFSPQASTIVPPVGLVLFLLAAAPADSHRSVISVGKAFLLLSVNNSKSAGGEPLRITHCVLLLYKKGQISPFFGSS